MGLFSFKKDNQPEDPIKKNIAISKRLTDIRKQKSQRSRNPYLSRLKAWDEEEITRPGSGFAGNNVGSVGFAGQGQKKGGAFASGDVGKNILDKGSSNGPSLTPGTFWRPKI